MTKIVTVTSKRQITIPVELFDRLNLEVGDKLVMKIEGSQLQLQKAQKNLDALAGSVKIPTRFKGMSLDEIIEKSKQEHFSNQS